MKKTQQSKLKNNSPAVPAAAFSGRSAAAAFSWLSSDGREEDRRQGVSHTNEKNTAIKTEKNSPAVQAAAFAGRSAAAAFSWLSPDGREEDRRQGVSITVGITDART